MIRGPGAGKLTVRRAVVDRFRIFTIAQGANVTISGLTVSNGLLLRTPRGHGTGGGIANYGTLTVRESTISGNKAWEGGGISNDGGRLMVVGSTFSGNEAGQGAGIAIFGGTQTVRNSTFSGNTAKSGAGIANYGRESTLTVKYSTFSGNKADDGSGGGILNRFAQLTVRNSTFSANRATEVGGGIKNSGDSWGKVAVVSSTFSRNSATGSGGGLYNENSSATTFSLRASIIAGNDAPNGPDASGSFRSGGYNLIGNTTGATGFGGSTNLTNTRSGLARGLRDNGGPTKTIALVSSSPAIDAVPRTVCPPPATDQRGISRPQDGDDDGAARCDIGAYERRAPAQ